jgi:hypothetical protein
LFIDFLVIFRDYLIEVLPYQKVISVLALTMGYVYSII